MEIKSTGLPGGTQAGNCLSAVLKSLFLFGYTASELLFNAIQFCVGVTNTLCIFLVRSAFGNDGVKEIIVAVEITDNA